MPLRESYSDAHFYLRHHAGEVGAEGRHPRHESPPVRHRLVLGEVARLPGLAELVKQRPGADRWSTVDDERRSTTRESTQRHGERKEKERTTREGKEREGTGREWCHLISCIMP